MCWSIRRGGNSPGPGAQVGWTDFGRPFRRSPTVSWPGRDGGTPCATWRRLTAGIRTLTRSLGSQRCCRTWGNCPEHGSNGAKLSA